METSPLVTVVGFARIPQENSARREFVRIPLIYSRCFDVGFFDSLPNTLKCYPRALTLPLVLAMSVSYAFAQEGTDKTNVVTATASEPETEVNVEQKVDVDPANKFVDSAGDSKASGAGYYNAG